MRQLLKYSDMWGRTRNDIIASACEKLKDIFASVCETHGYDHSVTVMNHCAKALEHHKGTSISEPDQILILLASLCHDADDYKFWKNSNNTSQVLKFCSNDQITETEESFVHRMIDYVGCSKNWNRIPEEARDRPELLYPRHSDRLEALGEIGIERTYVYSVKQKNPLFVESTPKPTTEKELWQYASNERFESYTGNSASMLDHFYDKLLHVGHFESDNEYLQQQAKERSQIMVDVCLYYGKNQTLHPIFQKFEVLKPQ